MPGSPPRRFACRRVGREIIGETETGIGNGIGKRGADRSGDRPAPAGASSGPLGAAGRWRRALAPPLVLLMWRRGRARLRRLMQGRPRLPLGLRRRALPLELGRTLRRRRWPHHLLLALGRRRRPRELRLALRRRRRPPLELRR